VIAEEVALSLAFILGVVYNGIIALRRKYRPRERNLVAIEVIIGVMAVLLLGSFVRADRHYVWHFGGATGMLNNGQSAAWIFFRLFCFAGLPMVAGSIWRSLAEIVKPGSD